MRQRPVDVRPLNYSLVVSVALLSVAGVTIIGAAATAMMTKRRQSTKTRKRANDDDNNENNHGNKRDDDNVIDQELDSHPNHHRLPSHLERELYKEERREKMIPFLAMKKPMYDNIIMKDPSGNQLNTISLKKAKWYIRKNLALWEEENSVIRLLFEPERNKHRTQSTKKASLRGSNQQAIQTADSMNLYNKSVKENKCVVCGFEKDYRRHYIVPYCYRSCFPKRFKTHLPHDVVILCPDCHMRAQQVCHEYMAELEDDLRRASSAATSTNFEDSIHPNTTDFRLAMIKSAANALLRRRDQLPQDKVETYTKLVQDYFENQHQQQEETGISTITLDKLRIASQVESRIPNPRYISGSHLVMQHLQNQIDQKKDTADPELDVLGDFVRQWRKLFVNTMQPQYLAVGWSLDAPVSCDR